MTITTRTTSWPIIAGVVALLVIHFVLALSASTGKSPGFDEPAHVVAGVAYWKFNDYRLHPDNGNFPQRWAAIPLVLAGYRFPSTDQPAWWQSKLWTLGPSFLFDQGNDAQAMLLRARAMIALLSVTLGVVVFVWSRHCFGTAGGFVSLTLWAFCPVVLANAASVTSDMAAALALTLAMSAWWRMLARTTPASVALAGAATGLAMLAKMSGLLILPMASLLVVIRIAWRDAPLAGKSGTASAPVTLRVRRLFVYALAGVGAAIVSGSMIWAAFGFRHAAFASSQPGRDTLLDPWVWSDANAGGAARIASAFNTARLLPEAYLNGVAYQSWVNNQPTTAFLNGRWADRGFRLFFPEVFAIKMPLAFFAITVVAMLACLRSLGPAPSGESAPRTNIASQLAQRAFPYTPLLVLTTVYALAAMTSPRNAGVRHLMPIYPAIFILLGCVGTGGQRSHHRGSRVTRPRTRQIVTLALLTLFAAESLIAWPNYIGYFNPLVGGAANAHRVVVESSLDWGQELANLRRSLDALGSTNDRDTPIYLAYFGTGSPEYYGIRAIPLPGFGRPTPVSVPPQPLAPGVYCVSATILQSLYVSPKGPWTQASEASYQHASSLVSQFDRLAPSDRQAFAGVFEQLRFKRLCAYLRSRAPDDHVNGSILIYRLGASDLDRALRGEPAELLGQPVIQP